MKIGLVVAVMAVLAGSAASRSEAHQTQQGTAKIAAAPAPQTVAKPAPTNSVASAVSRRGSLGGSVGKRESLNGTGMQPKVARR
jgi:hypothetical protein